MCSINVLWDKFDFTVVKQARFDDKELERYTVRKGDLLICEGGDIGRAAIWNQDNPILYQNALHRVRLINNDVIPRFVMLFLKYLKLSGVLDTRYGKGVTIKHLVKSSLLSIPIPVPERAEQERIVGELDCLSGIIANKRAQLRELDTLAQSIFYTMFGDPISNDKGWQTKKFGDIFRLKSGDSLSSEKYMNGDFPVYGGNGISGFHDTFNKNGEYLIIGRVGAYCGNVRYVIGKFWLTDNAFEVIMNTNDYDNQFLCILLNVINLHQYANHAAQPVISNSGLKNVMVISPSIDLQKQFAEKIENIERQKELITKSIKETEDLFNSRMSYYFD